MPLDTVFFDAAGTLFRVRETVGTLYWREAGKACEPGDEDPAARLDDAFSRVLGSRPPLLFPDAPDEKLPLLEREWWREAVLETFREAGLQPVPSELFHRIYQHYATAAAWKLEPGCRAVLEELRSRGYRLGVISNFDSRLPPILAELGIRELFDTVTVSSLVRAEKPDAAIFERALAAAGTSAERALHIGDTPLHDIQGAQAVGLSAILYDPQEQQPWNPGTRIRDLREVLHFLV